MIHACTPSNFCAFASCDPIYMHDHAPALAASCALSGTNLHIHVVSASGDDIDFLLTLYERAQTLNKEVNFTFSFSTIDLSELSAEQRRVYYSLDRFITVGEMVDEGLGAVFITDIDCLIMGSIPQLGEDIGLFIREPFNNGNPWETLGSNVAAGAVYINNTEFAKKYIKEVSEDLKTRDLRWFTDQVVLWEKYKLAMRDNQGMSCRSFGPDFMDWEFIEGTTIWTGKGPRKYDNPVYVGKKKEFAELLEM